MRVLVCGGRDFNDESAVMNELLRLEEERGPFSLVMHGAATGADTIADKWARFERIAIRAYPANWKKHGKAAGPIRNQRMIDDGKPDLVIAFPGGRGTADMINRAIAHGIEVIRPAPTPPPHLEPKG